MNATRLFVAILMVLSVTLTASPSIASTHDSGAAASSGASDSSYFATTPAITTVTTRASNCIHMQSNKVHSPAIPPITAARRSLRISLASPIHSLQNAGNAPHTPMRPPACAQSAAASIGIRHQTEEQDYAKSDSAALSERDRAGGHPRDRSRWCEFDWL
jgi:hypothetical protein